MGTFREGTKHLGKFREGTKRLGSFREGAKHLGTFSYRKFREGTFSVWTFCAMRRGVNTDWNTVLYYTVYKYCGTAPAATGSVYICGDSDYFREIHAVQICTSNIR